MALPGVSSLKSAIEGLSPTMDASQGMQNFANAIADYMDQVQAGPLGLPGIFALNRATFASQLAALPQVSDTSWTSGVANAWETAVLASTIVPSTVIDPTTWTASTTDVNTLPTAAATILTISAAKAVLQSALSAATFDNNPAEPMAQAFNDATSAFQFNTIGIALPSVPVPVPRSAQ